MLKQEIKKLFIKNRLLIILPLALLFDIIFILITFNDNIASDPSIGYCSAWTVLMNESGIDWILVLLTVVMTMRIWINEYAFNMQLYNLTSVNGRMRLAAIKLLINVTVVIITVVIFDSARTLLYGMKLSFEDVSLTQAGILFETSKLDISAMTACFASYALHAAGFVFFCSICVFFAVLIKTSVNYLGACCAAIIVPLYLFDDMAERARLPLPVSLMQSSFMFMGEMTNRKGEMTADDIVLSGAVQLALAVVLMTVSAFIFAGKKPHFPKAAALSALVVFSFTLCSCAVQLPDENSAKYICVSARGNQFYCKETKQFMPVDPTPLENRILLDVVGDYGIVNESISYINNLGTNEIKVIDLNDLSVVYTFQSVNAYDETGLMGLYDIIDIPYQFLYDTTYYSYLDFSDNKLYLLTEDHILCVDIQSGKQTKLLEGVDFTGVKCTSNGVYYTVETEHGSALYLNDHTVCDFPVQTFIASDNAVAVVNAEDNNAYLITDGKVKELSQDRISSFFYTDESITVFDEFTDEGRIIAAVINGEKRVYEDIEGYYMFYADADGLYYTNENADQVIMRDY